MKVWDQLIMKQIREKGRTKTVVCTNQKQTCTKCDVVLFDVQSNAGKNDIYKKRHMNEFINVFHIFINGI